EWKRLPLPLDGPDRSQSPVQERAAPPEIPAKAAATQDDRAKDSQTRATFISLTRQADAEVRLAQNVADRSAAPIPAVPNLNDLVFLNDQSGWVVGTGGTILHTANGGASWQRQESGTTSELHAIKFVDAKYGWIVGAEATVLRTKDGGKTWSAAATKPV